METFEDIFKSLGDENRLRIIALFVRTRQALCVCEVVDALNLPQYRISRHVRHLKEAGLLKVNKRGAWSYYYLNEVQGFRKQLFDFLEKFLVSEQLDGDELAINARLAYREKGRCVVGSVPFSRISRQKES
ncbi:metalloregulator ArsR/SmtB family transcription factor [Balneolales bacterium ANBcel1]|nr:metalloregulator ArsR/SmtB family transcription factor [Balneolales bacterium ANBcel1]